MACFTDKPYADWSYEFLVTIGGGSRSGVISLGCYATMTDSQKRYQFYKALWDRSNTEDELLSASCFEELTEDKQYNLINTFLDLVLNPPLPPI